MTFEQLMEQTPLARVGYGVLYSWGYTVDEAHQEARIALWESCKRYGSASAVAAILRNAEKDKLRSTDIMTRKPYKAEGNNFYLDLVESSKPYALDGFNDLTKGLKPDQRDLLSKIHVEGYEHTEIAKMLGVPTGTVKSRISRIYSKLRGAENGDV